MSAIPLTGKGRVTLNLAMLINMLSIGSTMMVMPLAADLASPLNMPPQYAGYIAGLAGLAAALASCAAVQTSTQLMCLFALSGVFAGPMGATLMAAIVDMTPAAQRGRQLAYVAMGFSLAGIAVVPLALGISGHWWRRFVVDTACGHAVSTAG